MFEISKVEDLISVQSRKHKIRSSEYLKSGLLPIIDQSSDYIGGYTDDLGLAYQGDLPVIIFGDHTCNLKFVDFKFAVGADGTQVIRPCEGLDARYLYFALHTTGLKQYGYQRHFKLLRQCKISVPLLDDQKRIASVLGAYDDLIEVNRRRIAILEEMARGSFEEWFVRFRFPGHETVEMVETPNGVFPKGWQVVQLGKVLALSYGKALKADTRVAGDVSVIGSSGVVGSHNTPLVKGPGVVVGRKGNVGSVIWSPNDFWPIDTTYFVETELPCSFVFQMLSRVKFENTDAAVPGLNRDYALSREVVLPENSVITQYDDFAATLQAQVDILVDSNQKLAASRDLLLPRLISGQLSVEKAEKDLEQVV